MANENLKDGDYRVICRGDKNPDGGKGRYYMSRHLYTNELDAIVDAQCINIEFEPAVVRVTWRCK